MSDIERDAHLLAALRHAPDAQAGAPAHLGAQIVAAAHRAVAEPAPRNAPPARRWPWLNRLGASGALATVALAGVLGLLWRGERPGPAVEDAPTAAPTSVPMPMPAPAAPPEPAPAPPPVQASPASAPSPRPPARPAPRAEAPLAQEAVAAAQQREAAQAAQTRRVEREERAERAAVADAARAAATAPRPALAAAPPPPPPAAMPAPPPVPWLAALAAGDAVEWQLEGRPWTPAPDWLHALAEVAAGRAQPADGPPPTAAGEVVLAWARRGEPAARLWLGPQRLLWCDAASRCQSAALDTAAAAALRRTLPR